MSDTWIYQKNFALANTDEVNLDEKKIKVDYFLQDYSVPRNLFDEDFYMKRSVLISELDENLVDENSCNKYLTKMKDVKTLIILNDRPKNNSPIFADFSRQILKAYIMMFEENKIKCYYTDNF